MFGYVGVSYVGFKNCFGAVLREDGVRNVRSEVREIAYNLIYYFDRYRHFNIGSGPNRPRLYHFL